MHQLNSFLATIDSYIGGSAWFVFLLLGTGLFFTLYLGFPQIRYFRHALRVVRGKYDDSSHPGDATHFQALTTALSGTVGTGNIAGVALAIYLGGPAALFWMLVTAFFGMTTKFVEVTLSHKYRDILPDGSISGGPMYYMKKRLNLRLSDGRTLRVGYILGVIFAVATIFSSFGTGSLPQINSISNALRTSFGLNPMLTGAVLSVLLAMVILGGIRRIARVTEKLVPAMALIYLVGALSVILYNYDQILPGLGAIFLDSFSGTAAVGGFLGASLSFAINRGVTRGLFSNEAGQGSAPIAHAAAKANEPVSEGMVAILEPFIDTIIICTLTGLVIVSSGVWKEKFENDFQYSDLEVVQGRYSDASETDKQLLAQHISGQAPLALFTGTLQAKAGELQPENYTVLHARSVAEAIRVLDNKGTAYSGPIRVQQGKLAAGQPNVHLRGRSLLHSAPLTAEAFKRSFFGNSGQYIVAIGLLLFAFSTAISWSYYGGRSITFLFGPQYVIYYRIVYVVGFFLASFVDTTIVWTFSGITIALMTIPNLFGLLILHREVKQTIAEYWTDFRKQHPKT